MASTKGERRIRELLGKNDPALQRKGILRARQEHIYAALPALATLIAASDSEIAGLAAECTVSLAQECIDAREPEASAAARAAAVSIIKNYGSHLIEERMQFLYSKDSATVNRGLIFLKHFVSESQAESLLARFLNHPDSRVRATVVLHIGTIIGRRGIAVLNTFLQDSDNRVKANAVESIERIGDKDLVAILSRFRADANNRIRANVLKALTTVGKTDVYDDLKSMLIHKSHLMRASAIWVIRETGEQHRRYIGLLRLVMNDTDRLVRDNLLLAAKRLGRALELGFLQHALSEKEDSSIKARIIVSKDIVVQSITRETYLLIKLKGSITARTILSLKLTFEHNKLIEDNQQIVLDCIDVDYIDSSGIGFLLNLSRKMRERQGMLLLCNCNLRIMELLQLNQVDRALHIFQNEEEIQEFIV